MFDIAPTELLLCALVALVVIGPKDLPKAMRVVGHWVGRARGMARQFRSGFDAMVREAELEEMEKKWAAENERIMREHPPEAHAATASEPVTMAAEDPVSESHPSGPNLVKADSPPSDPSSGEPPAPVSPSPAVVAPAEPAIPQPAESAPPATTERIDTAKSLGKSPDKSPGQLDLGLGGPAADAKP